MMDTRIAFCRHWWKFCYHCYLSARSKRARKAHRVNMRETVKTILEFKKEARDEGNKK